MIIVGQAFGQMSANGAGNTMGLQNRMGFAGLGSQTNQGFFPFLTPDGVDTLLDGFAGKKRRKRYDYTNNIMKVE